MVRNLRSFFIFLMATILMLGFQNCSNVTDINDQEVVNTNLSLLVDSKISADEVSLYSYDKNTNEESLFSIRRIDSVSFQIKENDKDYLCSVSSENAFDTLIETINSVRVSHPNKISKETSVCSSYDLPSQYLVINSSHENIYVVFKNKFEDDCLSFNSDVLMKAGKRAFITDSADSDEINEMFLNSQDMLDILSCTELDRQGSMAGLIK